MNARRAADERGVSLIEVLVAVSIMGLIMTALTGALFVGLRTTRDTHTSLDQSNAEQALSTQLTKDIQAATAVRTSGTSACGGQPVVLETTTRTDPLGADNVTVAYRLVGSELVRQVCGPTPSTRLLAHNITALTASGTNPVSITVATSASAEVGAYSWTLEVRRRQA